MSVDIEEGRRLLADWDDLLVQATRERSHFYVASVARRSVASFAAILDELEAARRDAERLANALRAFYEINDLPVSPADALAVHDAAIDAAMS